MTSDDDAGETGATSGTSEEELRTFQKRKLELEIQDHAQSPWRKPTTWINLVGVIVALLVATTGWVYRSNEVERARLELKEAELDLRSRAQETADALRQRDATLAEKAKALTEAEHAKREADAYQELTRQERAKVTAAQEELTALQDLIKVIRQGIGPDETELLLSVDAAATSVSENLKNLALLPDPLNRIVVKFIPKQYSNGTRSKADSGTTLTVRALLDGKERGKATITADQWNDGKAKTIQLDEAMWIPAGKWNFLTFQVEINSPQKNDGVRGEVLIDGVSTNEQRQRLLSQSVVLGLHKEFIDSWTGRPKPEVVDRLDE